MNTSKRSVELRDQAAALVAQLEARLEVVSPPHPLTRLETADLAGCARRLNCVLTELDNVLSGAPEPPQCRD